MSDVAAAVVGCNAAEAEGLRSIIAFISDGSAGSAAGEAGTGPPSHLMHTVGLVGAALSRHSRKTETSAMSAVSSVLATTIRLAPVMAAGPATTATERTAGCCTRALEVAASAIVTLGRDGSSAQAFRAAVVDCEEDWAERQRRGPDPLPDDIGARRIVRAVLLAVEIAAAQTPTLIRPIVQRPWGRAAGSLMEATSELLDRQQRLWAAGTKGAVPARPADLSPPPTILAWVWRLTGATEWAAAGPDPSAGADSAGTAEAVSSVCRSVSAGFLAHAFAVAEPTDAADLVAAMRVVIADSEALPAAADAADPAGERGLFRPRVARAEAEAFIATLGSVDRYRLLPRAAMALWSDAPAAAAVVVGRAASAMARAAEGGRLALAAADESAGAEAGGESGGEAGDATESSGSGSPGGMVASASGTLVSLRGQTALEVKGRVELLQGAASLLAATAASMWRASSGAATGGSVGSGLASGGERPSRVAGRGRAGMSAMTAVLRTSAAASAPTSIAASGAGTATLVDDPRDEFADDPSLDDGTRRYDGSTRTPVWRPELASMGSRVSAAAAARAAMTSRAEGATGKPTGRPLDSSPLPWVDPEVPVPFDAHAPSGGDSVAGEWHALVEAFAALGMDAKPGQPEGVVSVAAGDVGAIMAPGAAPGHQSDRRPRREAADDPQPSTSDTLLRMAEREGALGGLGSGVEDPVIGVAEDSEPHVALATTAQVIRGPPSGTVGTKTEKTRERRAIARKSLLEALAAGSAAQPEGLASWLPGDPDWAMCLAQAGTVLSLQRLVAHEAVRRGNWRVAFAISRCLDVARPLAGDTGAGQPAMLADPALTEEGLRASLGRHPRGTAAAAEAASSGRGAVWQPALVIVRSSGDTTEVGAAGAHDTVRVAELSTLSAATGACRALCATADGSAAPLIVAMDVEWRPSGKYDTMLPPVLMSGGEGGARAELHPWHPRRLSWPASTLQLATTSGAWVLDLLALGAEAADSGRTAQAAEFCDALRDLMRHRRVIKAGWGVSGDLSKVAASHLWLAGALRVSIPLLELQTAIPAMAEAAGAAAPAELCAAAEASGLSGAAREVLGLPLAKAQQTSDWQRRPLSHDQVAYAATDALATACLAKGALEFCATACDVSLWWLTDTTGGVKGPDSEPFPFLPPVVGELTLTPHDVASAAPSFAFAVQLAESPGSFRGDCEAACSIPPGAASGPDPQPPLSRLWLRGMFDPAPVVTAAARAATASSAPVAAAVPLAVGQRNHEHVLAAMACRGIPASRLLDAPGSPTAELAAQRLGVPHGAVIKSLGLMVGGFPALALVAGGRRMDYKLVGAAVTRARKDRGLEFGSRRARMAKPEECVPTFGFAPGAFPPLGGRCGPGDCGDDGSLAGEGADRRFVVVMDESVKRAGVARDVLPPQLAAILPADAGRVVFAGGGTEHHMTMLTAEELALATEAEVAPITKAGSAPDASARAAGGADGPADRDTAFDPDAFGPDSGWLRCLFPRPRFLIDSSLGRLTRWLRVVGIDTEQRRKGEGIGAALARSVAERRMFVTRDYKVAGRKGVRWTVLLLQNDTGSQFEELTAHCGLTCSVDDLMSRCSKCNGRGYKVLSRPRVLELGGLGIHPKVLSSVSTYFQCLSCEAVYWAGPKFDSTRAHFAGLVVR